MEKLIVQNYFYPAFVNPPPTLSFADQFAFRPGGSTTAALIALLQTITNMLRTNPYVIVIALDFSKAFDTVRHSTFAEKLASLDMPDSVYNWVISHLTGHSHKTLLAGEESDFESITASFIQGSGLGPASYSVGASDLHPVTEGNEIIKFADDTDLVIPARNIASREVEIQHVQSWAANNNLNLNCKKSYEIIFRKPRSRGAQDVPELPGVTRVSTLKILGVTLTSNFSMADNVSDVIASSGQSLYGVYALRILRANGMIEKNQHTIFRASVIAKLTYASQAWWGFANADVRGRLQAFIRRSIKAGFCPGDFTSFDDLCERADDKFFKCVSVDTHPLHRFFPPRISRRKRRERPGGRHASPTEIKMHSIIVAISVNFATYPASSILRPAAKSPFAQSVNVACLCINLPGLENFPSPPLGVYIRFGRCLAIELGAVVSLFQV